MALGKSNLFSKGLFGLSIVDRYIAAEIILPFLFIVGLVSSLGVAGGTIFDIVRQITEYGLLISVAIKFILLKMPQFIAYAFPVSVLLATLMGYSRLSGQSELIALRSIGMSLYRIVLPAFLFSLFVAGLSFAFNEYVVPTANYQAAVMLEKALGEERPNLQADNIFYPEYQQVSDENQQQQKVLKRLFYAERLEGETMKGVTVLDRSQEGINVVIIAKSAKWNLGQGRWDLYNGTSYQSNVDGSSGTFAGFEHLSFQFPRAPLDVASRDRDLSEMNIAQSLAQLDALKMANDEKKIRQVYVRVQQRIAFPFVCVVFCLLGSAIGTRPLQTNRATSFGVAVAIVFIYYVMNFVSVAMGSVGVFSPFVAAWLANLFGFGVGGWLLFKSAA
ncbi:LptF/LptG family permease [Lusitaniella coriacea LEGE 07157]|uniref:LptF/LptG family permease n=1 Tax=Lusitaniella coriacea LEGE 07157 TaxID=945747 RepID=A0A8J7AYH9_9CYAN|nr:LptF/LptG family permease [Lusitaniella coriacea]MBE9114914.1 LptF/LptG family permease [Lusitaniella coriacea LEGE 07157]